MRARNLKPGLFKNELLGGADPLITILFEGLWCSADREGRLEDRPLRLCAEVFPYRRKVTEKHVEKMLSWLHLQKFIERYEVDGKRYIQVLAFWKHQTPHSKERPSEIPALSSHQHQSRSEHDTDLDDDEQQPRQLPARSDSGFLTPDSGLLTPHSPDLRPSEHVRRPNPAGEETNSGAVAPAAVIAVRLYELQVKVTSDHPTLLKWIADRYTLDQLLNAVKLARTTKPTGWIPANYLDAVLRDPGPSKSNGARAQQRNDQNRSAVQEWLDDDAMGAA